MAKRKTVEIATLVDLANQYFLQSHDDLVSEREGIQSFISEVLHNSGNYKGYRYLSPFDMAGSKQGTTFGVQYNIDNKPIFGDKSRVYYYK